MTDEFGIDEWLAEDVTPEQKRDWPSWAPIWEALIFSPVSDRAVRLYAALSTWSGLPGIWPSRRTLADLIGCSVDSVDRAKTELLEAGWISVSGRVRPTDGGQTSNLYRLHQSAGARYPGRESAHPPLGDGAAPRTTHSSNHKPPTPSDVAAGQPTRTYQGTIRTAEELEQLDGSVRTRVPVEKVKALKDQIRPGRSSEELK